MYLNAIEIIIAANIIMFKSKKVLMHQLGYKMFFIDNPSTTKTSNIKSETDIIAPIEPNISIL